MKSIYENIVNLKAEGEKLLAVLIDPDKMKMENLDRFIDLVNKTRVSFIFVGGSTVPEHKTEHIVDRISVLTQLPIVLFPGDITQITNKADAVLFLSLISGRNPEYLIEKHVSAVSKLKHSDLEVIPTGYVLIENGKETAVERVTQTTPIPRVEIQRISDTAKAGEYLGMKLIYLEAGSGAMHPISKDIIVKVNQDITIPLIVGGGIRNTTQIDDAFKAGADIVVVGTALEEDESFFKALQ